MLNICCFVIIFAS